MNPAQINPALDRIAQELREDEETTFTFQQAQGWAVELGFSEERPSSVIAAMRLRGFTMSERKPPRKFRTISSNPHDRWQASPTHGGAGGSSIEGLAGRAG